MILKLKHTPGIYLAGFMGCGKSTVGRALADELGWSFADLDEDIEKREKASILEIFESRGEPAFREIEAEVLADRVKMVRAGRPLVLALGGGAFVQEANFSLLADHGVSVWLDCPWDMVLRRVTSESQRPLARYLPDLERLFHSRRDAYARADFHVQIEDDDTRSAVSKILALPLF